MNFGALETFMQAAISGMVSKDAVVGDCEGTNLSFTNRVKVFDALIRGVVTDDAILTEHKALMKELLGLEEERNALVHASWLDQQGTNIDQQKLLFKPKITLHKGYQGDPRSMTPADIAGVTNKTHAATLRLRDFLAKLTAAHIGHFFERINPAKS